MAMEDSKVLRRAAPATKNPTQLLKTTEKYCVCHTERLWTRYETCPEHRILIRINKSFMQIIDLEKKRKSKQKSYQISCFFIDFFIDLLIDLFFDYFIDFDFVFHSFFLMHVWLL
jgi:hypothetical protein